MSLLLKQDVGKEAEVVEVLSAFNLLAKLYSKDGQFWKKNKQKKKAI